MLMVIFELVPVVEKRDRYFELAAELKHKLSEIDGFISIERFESLSEPGKYLSLSCWRDEEAVSAWRNQVEHRDAQRIGREDIFSHYRLRVAQVVRDYEQGESVTRPGDSKCALQMSE